ncbi:formate dehydrogenase accessory protein FdhE [Paraburkholderia sp.]|uniref:formate dehydrogenase accessory protein FdhE n=1 Tax=Paraburkholderia sp. TaxID=1926495 RepID=UPI00239732FC|nr:formate dehydrogenase accessory protein FdhE [Paraburkholderia sp.]MDE1180098.1 formate dehydrogenase accessory protein FdhE [Paraburkholderia sp.]
MPNRILDPGEIESLDHTAIPRIALPSRATTFSARAARLRTQSTGSPIGGYIRLMSTVADAQHQLLAGLETELPSADQLATAQQHSMPLIPALSPFRETTGWQTVLHRLLDKVEAGGAVTPALARVIDSIREKTDPQLDAQADAMLAHRYNEIDPATAPFIMAALQVVWTDLACCINARDVPYVEPGVCPVCGSLPVASVVRVGGSQAGLRYLQCGLCASEWHMVRAKCSNCDSTKGIAYHGIDGGNPALKAESCDECHTYRKIGYQEKDYDFEPLADDLASLTLDLLMNEAGYQRAAPNPLLWPEVPSDDA